MGKIKVRRARRDDIDRIGELTKGSATSELWPSAPHDWLFRLLDRAGQETILIALSEGRIAGVIGFVSDRFETNDVYWLGVLHVVREGQQARLLKKLIQKVIKEARRRGGRKLYADAVRFDFAGDVRSSYEKLGFKAEATLKDYYGPGIDQIVYGLTLS